MNDQNLIPPKKGEIRNPKGKPKGTLNLKTLIRKVLDKEIDIDDPLIKNSKTKKRIIEAGLEKQAKRWMDGDNTAGKDLLDRYFGKAKDNLNIKAEVTTFQETIGEFFNKDD